MIDKCIHKKQAIFKEVFVDIYMHTCRKRENTSHERSTTEKLKIKTVNLVTSKTHHTHGPNRAKKSKFSQLH